MCNLDELSLIYIESTFERRPAVHSCISNLHVRFNYRPRLSTGVQWNSQISCRWNHPGASHLDVQQTNIQGARWARMDQVWIFYWVEATDKLVLAPQSNVGLFEIVWSYFVMNHKSNFGVTKHVVWLVVGVEWVRIPLANLFQGNGITKLPSSSFALTSRSSGRHSGNLTLTLTHTPHSFQQVPCSCSHFSFTIPKANTLWI